MHCSIAQPGYVCNVESWWCWVKAEQADFYNGAHTCSDDLKEKPGNPHSSHQLNYTQSCIWINFTIKIFWSSFLMWKAYIWVRLVEIGKVYIEREWNNGPSKAIPNRAKIQFPPKTRITHRGEEKHDQRTQASVFTIYNSNSTNSTRDNTLRHFKS